MALDVRTSMETSRSRTPTSMSRRRVKATTPGSDPEKGNFDRSCPINPGLLLFLWRWKNHRFIGVESWIISIVCGKAPLLWTAPTTFSFFYLHRIENCAAYRHEIKIHLP